MAGPAESRMRLTRAALLERFGGPETPPVVVLEAPIGYGKSWVLRRLAGQDAFRVRDADDLDEVRSTLESGRSVIVDDAIRRLDADGFELLIELIEDADGPGRLYIAGRILPDAALASAQLVDAAIGDATTLAVTAAELAQEVPELGLATATRIVDSADGCIKIVATVVDQMIRQPTADPVGLVSRMVRTSSVASLQHLGERDAAVLGLVTRAPGIERPLLDKLAGPGFVERCVDAGIPLRRLVTGEFDLAIAAAYRSGPVDAAAATELSHDLIDRDRPLEGIGLLLDAGLHEQAAASLMALSESITDTVEPRSLLGLLARLGTTTDREPSLLLYRAAAARDIGQVDQAAADIDRAVELAATGDPTVLRRAEVEAARARLAEGQVAEAVRIAEQALLDVADGEDRTYARAYQVLADCAATADSRLDLQRAAECYRVAAGAWESCGELARARSARCDLAVSVLVPLGRFDEALALLGQLLSATDMSDAERSWTMLMEGFVLQNANRLESAESRFVRVTDIGYLQDNPRLVASSAWGRALVAARRGDLEGTLRWIASAENTALADTDDVLGIPFLCDAATSLGALGELDVAGRYLDRAVRRRPLFPDQVRATAFLLDARRGRLGDLDAALQITPPAEWWRTYLVAALCHAREGDIERARHLLADSQRELIALGLSDASSMGEAWISDQLHTLLQRAPEPAPTSLAPVPLAVATPVPGRGRRLCVIGEPMVVHHGSGSEVIPPGNPQRLVGVVVANGGSASLDQISEAIWPGDEVDTSRARLRNVLMRLRRASGDVVVRSGSGVRLAPGLSCDLHEFDRLASDALSSARVDPDVAGRLAVEALAVGEGTVFVDFEYEEWAIAARRSAEQRMISLLDLLSVQAEDDGDLPAAQALAERALRLDRYTDSRYVRLAELLAMQQRVAAAIAVLDDAAEVARELGGALPSTVLTQRSDLVRRASSM